MNSIKLIDTSEVIIRRYILFWSAGLIAFSLFVSILSIPINNYDVAKILGKITPAIEKWTDASNHKDVAKMTWLYMTYTAPLMITLLVLKLKRVEVRKPILGFLIICCAVIVFSCFFVDGSALGIADIGNVTPDAGGGGSGLYKMYKKSIVGTISLSCCIGAGFIWSNTYLIVWLKQEFISQYFNGHT